MQAREPDTGGVLLGTFIPTSETQKLLVCQDPMNSEVCPSTWPRGHRKMGAGGRTVHAAESETLNFLRHK